MSLHHATSVTHTLEAERQGQSAIGFVTINIKVPLDTSDTMFSKSPIQGVDPNTKGCVKGS
ncbi:hypothetical protein ASPSYDRAFT_45486 [Aspergillus sydowii CBS 593.65]|uniref:Uncharacterized protein n=1 Tax=Aspergillus sydowii CBS 593.65 TaxID=1036612 RepID=A0A1L9TI15_9EURO|nr:uncharacterized protein ASPSYDRAFT_45486 [Aspergillus sydowii CBS 593.65]OJJ59052.1 hypothetical protein ASPSYDRAFT_45486 [Aspergillus sydowii CBS 593.65]